MLYHLLYPLSSLYPYFNVFKYISFRTIYALLTALLITLFLAPWLMKKLKASNISQHIRWDGPNSHLKKEGTPTMGGVLILGALFCSVLLWADLRNAYLWVAIFTAMALGFLGFQDDHKKLKERSPSGLKMRYKLIIQILIGAGLGVFLYFYPDFDTHLSFPFFKKFYPDLGPFYIPLAILVIVATSNAVNLADGLDGLAIGLVLIVAGTYLLLAYLAGNVKTAYYLQIPYIAGSGELSIFCGALIGAGVGFLWYNAYPAQLFMGDVGSLSLGGALGAVALLTKHETLLCIVGGIFVIEALSVIFQVGSYKWRRKRMFLMAPLHHHFELKGWSEPKIIVRFWIIGFFLALLAISTLKLR